MSQRPIGASPDLSRLVAEGFDVSIVEGHLVVRGVPFLDADGRVGHGILVSTLDLAGDVTLAPRSHVAYFGGGTPCDGAGRPLPMLHARASRLLAEGLPVDHMLSSRPSEGGHYPDYHAKMNAYASQIDAPARAVDPSASARRASRGDVGATSGASPFRYVDTASSRAGIGAFTARLARHTVAIVGLGGGGSYVLDLLAKTPVARIHLWDPDVFEQHSAFRAPGAASAEELSRTPAKVDYLAAIYSRMHRGIVPHRARVGPANLTALGRVDFVFLALDSAASRRPIVDHLLREGRPFIDIGMGLQLSDEGIVGTVRVTTATPAMSGHVHARGRIPLDGDPADDPYFTNVQVADLNCLSAALAVIRWKRHLGFYADFEREHWSAYSVDGNALVNEERPA